MKIAVRVQVPSITPLYDRQAKVDKRTPAKRTIADASSAPVSIYAHEAEIALRHIGIVKMDRASRFVGSIYAHHFAAVTQ